jgi:hypothetical protein
VEDIRADSDGDCAAAPSSAAAQRPLSPRLPAAPPPAIAAPAAVSDLRRAGASAVGAAQEGRTEAFGAV